jgi:hypothetical protein
MATFFRLLFFIPFGLLGLGFAISNRHAVLVAFDPFAGEDISGAAITMPLFLIVFLAIIFGVILGSVATWFNQSKNRRASRIALAEVERLRSDLARASTQPDSQKRVALFRA